MSTDHLLSRLVRKAYRLKRSRDILLVARLWVWFARGEVVANPFAYWRDRQMWMIYRLWVDAWATREYDATESLHWLRSQTFLMPSVIRAPRHIDMGQV